MLLSSNAFLQGKMQDAFTSVVIAVCIIGQIAIENQPFDFIQAAIKCLIADSLASSTGLVVIADSQIAH